MSSIIKTDARLFTDQDLEDMKNSLAKSVKQSIASHTHSINTTSGYASGVISGNPGSGVWQGTGTAPVGGIWDSTTTTYYPSSPNLSSPAGPSWEELMKTIIEAAVKEVANEITETLKDLQEQIDEIWESLKDE